MSVGRSPRTPAKHELLDRLIGQEIGAAPYLPGGSADRVVLIDLCAGDAFIPEAPLLRKDGDWWYNCSPGIFIRHGKTSTLPVLIDLYEINRATYDRLIANLTMQLGQAWGQNCDGAICWLAENTTVRVAMGSGFDASVERIRPGDAVFIANDPNTIHDWALRPTMVSEVLVKTPWCRTFSTLGCNVGGLMMKDYEERQQWYKHTQALKEHLPRYHDMMLAAIDRDFAKWAYSITTAKKWRAKTTKITEDAFRKIGRNMNISWWRESPTAFHGLEDVLFMRRTEREDRL